MNGIDGKRVLVTGAAGLYGLNLVKTLIDDSDISHVIGIDDESRAFAGDIEVYKIKDEKFTYQKKDFRDLTSTDIDEMNIDTIVHLAAKVSCPESMKNRECSREYVAVNEVGTFELMQTLLETKSHPMMVYASSGAVYGKPQYVPKDINHPLNPNNVYGASKLAGEKHCVVWNLAEDYPLVVIRNFNTYGENQVILPDAAVISKFITLAIQNKDITIYGEGNNTQDFQYIGDAVEAYKHVILQGEKVNGKIYNLKTNQETSINDVAEIIVDKTSSESNIIHEEGRPCEQVGIMPTDYKGELGETLNWHHTHSVEQGLENTVYWFYDKLSEKINAGIFEK